MWMVIQAVLLTLGLLMFLGFCRHSYYLRKQFFHCPGCGATQLPVREVGLDDDDRDKYAVIVNCMNYRCDGPTNRCRNGYMVLVVRKWAWRLTRPFGWIWSPLPSMVNAIVAIVKRAGG